jgi:hypothetical protein
MLDLPLPPFWGVLGNIIKLNIETNRASVNVQRFTVFAVHSKACTQFLIPVRHLRQQRVNL